MLEMLLKMSVMTFLYVGIAAVMFRRTRESEKDTRLKILVGVVFGLCAVLSTHFGVDYISNVLNVRDMGPLIAGLFFHPVSGVIAGVIGGVERFVAGRYFGVGEFTTTACSISTFLAGIWAALLSVKLLKGKKPRPFYAFLMGAVVEVFHMYAVIITKRDDISVAFSVVSVCALPMILFCAAGMAMTSYIILKMSGEWNWRNPLSREQSDKISVSEHFQFGLFVTVTFMAFVTFAISYAVQTRMAIQNADITLEASSLQITYYLDKIEEISRRRNGSPPPEDATDSILKNAQVGLYGKAYVVDGEGVIVLGDNKGSKLLSKQMIKMVDEGGEEELYTGKTEDTLECRIRVEKIGDDQYLVGALGLNEVFENRDILAYETIFADLLLSAVIFVLISFLVQIVVTNKLNAVTDSLNRIADGQLDEVVDVRGSSEFAILSDDINLTVNALKGYIDAEKRRMEQELTLAREIQASSLPRGFVFPEHEEFELFATMDPAKEVGGDFYDFFFAGMNRLVLVIADVSGKGVPASLVMMQGKAAIRNLAVTAQSPSEIFRIVNARLCEGNDADMFVTAWIGILDLTNGVMQCVNAGHEYPVLMKAGGEYGLVHDRHAVALAVMEDVRFREYTMTLEPGDRLFVYTDGVPEAINAEDEQYGTDRLLAALNREKDSTMEETLPAVRKDISRFVGTAEQFDDITMLGLILSGYASE